MNKYFYCVDVGGTFIKSGIVDKDYNIIYKTETETKIVFEKQSLAEAIISIINNMEQQTGLMFKNSSGLGIGLPGLIDDKSGTIKFINCLKITNYNIKEEFKNFTSVPIHIANDAELATIAEYKLGAGKGLNSIAMLTLGTGIGSGIIINNVSLRQINPFSCELGHIKITENPNETFEKLASTKALVNQTKIAMQNNPDSKMWTKYNLTTVCGQSIFEFKETDKTAQHVFETYITHLGTGIANIYNIFTPDAIIIGGGISRQKDNLIDPLSKYVNNNIFTKCIGNKPKIIPANFMNDAGILGARCLFDL